MSADFICELKNRESNNWLIETQPQKIITLVVALSRLLPQLMRGKNFVILSENSKVKLKKKLFDSGISSVYAFEAIVLRVSRIADDLRRKA